MSATSGSGGGGGGGGSNTAGTVVGQLQTSGSLGRSSVPLSRLGAFTVTVEGTDISVNANADGTFRLDNVPPGPQVISASGNGKGAVVVITVASQGVSTTGVMVVQQAGSLGGTVTDTQSNPIAGALVTAAPVQGPEEEVAALANGRPIFAAVTNAQGQYTIPGLPPGQYLVAAHKPGYIDGTQTVQVGVQAVKADFTLQAVSGTSGTVAGTVSATVADHTVGIGHALVVLAPGGTQPQYLSSMTFTDLAQELPPTPTSRPEPPDQRPLFSITDAHGDFTIPDVPTGSYTLEVFAFGYEPASQSITVQAEQTTDVSVTLTGQFGTLTGQVTSAADGSPIDHAGVVAVGDDPFVPPVSGGPTPLAATANDLAQAPPVRAFAITDSNGNYSMELPSGHYGVICLARAFVVQAHGANISQGQTTDLNFQLNPTTAGNEGPGSDLAPMLSQTSP